MLIKSLFLWFFVLLSMLRTSGALALMPRRITEKDFYINLAGVSNTNRMIIKFTEDASVRVHNRIPYSKTGVSTQQLLDFLKLRSDITFRRETEQIPESVFDSWKAEGERNSGKALANLNDFYVLEIPHNPAPGELLRQALQLDIVETAWYAPKMVSACRDISPTTPSWESIEGYDGPAPSGLDALYAAQYHPAGRGNPNDSCIVLDYEFAGSHEDLPDNFAELPSDTGNPTDTNSDHGTGCAGILFACDNGYGTRGMSPAVHGFGIRNFIFDNYTTAMELAGSLLGPGNSISMSVQTQGPDPGFTCDPSCGDCSQFGDIAVEYYDDMFAAIQTNTARGIAVYTAAGNGQVNLDSPVYGNRFQRWFRDSGATLVAAAHPSPVEPTCWGNYGSRVDLNAWGGAVYSLGEGTISGFNDGGDRRQFYTSTFSGSSAATPMCCGAGNDLQGICQVKYGLTLSPFQLRSILHDQGTAALGSRLIGARPNLVLAIQRIEPDMLPWAVSGWYSPLVPRNAPNADSLSCGLSSLDGNNASTYLNLCAADTAITPAPDAGNSGVFTAVYLDSQLLDTFAWRPRISAGAIAFQNNRGPFVIRGGRHTLEFILDPQSIFGESHKDNNIFYAQYVWSPLQLTAPNSYAVRPAPPPKSWGNSAFFNGDGFRASPAAGSSSTWLGCALLPQPGNDLALYSYPDSFSSTDGFDTPQYSSQSAANSPELILINGNIVSPMSRLFQAVRNNDSSSADYAIEADVSVSIPPDQSYLLTKALDTDEIMDIYDLPLRAGTSYSVSAHDVMGGLDLRLAIFRPGAPYYSLSDAAWISDSSGAINLTPTESGSFAAVVLKSRSSFGRGGSYVFDFEPAVETLLPPVSTLVIQPWTDSNSIRLVWNHVGLDSLGNLPIGQRYIIFKDSIFATALSSDDSIGQTTDSTFIDTNAASGSNFYWVKVTR